MKYNLIRTKIFIMHYLVADKNIHQSTKLNDITPGLFMKEKIKSFIVTFQLNSECKTLIQISIWYTSGRWWRHLVCEWLIQIPIWFWILLVNMNIIFVMDHFIFVVIYFTGTWFPTSVRIFLVYWTINGYIGRCWV